MAESIIIELKGDRNDPYDTTIVIIAFCVGVNLSKTFSSFCTIVVFAAESALDFDSFDEGVG